MKHLPPCCFVVGPTASGKSAVAARIAQQLGSFVLNADAYQVYRGIEVLTAAPSESERTLAPHRLFSFLPASDEWNAYQHRERAIDELHRESSSPAVVTGGSGIYLKFISHGPSDLPASDQNLRAELDQSDLETLVSRLQQLDPLGAAKTNLKNRRYVTRNLEICLLTGRPFSEFNAPQWKPKLQSGMRGFFLDWDREELNQRIEERTRQMLDCGAIQEVERLKKPSSTCVKAIGIQQIRKYLAGIITRDECIDLIATATRQYAKRQRTWFRREQDWLTAIQVKSSDSPESVSDRILKQLKKL